LSRGLELECRCLAASLRPCYGDDEVSYSVLSYLTFLAEKNFRLTTIKSWCSFLVVESRVFFGQGGHEEAVCGPSLSFSSANAHFMGQWEKTGAEVQGYVLRTVDRAHTASCCNTSYYSSLRCYGVGRRCHALPNAVACLPQACLSHAKAPRGAGQGNRARNRLELDGVRLHCIGPSLSISSLVVRTTSTFHLAKQHVVRSNMISFHSVASLVPGRPEPGECGRSVSEAAWAAGAGRALSP
jgi:hypothetical protein